MPALQAEGQGLCGTLSLCPPLVLDFLLPPFQGLRRWCNFLSWSEPSFLLLPAASSAPELLLSCLIVFLTRHPWLALHVQDMALKGQWVAARQHRRARWSPAHSTTGVGVSLVGGTVSPTICIHTEPKMLTPSGKRVLWMSSRERTLSWT